MVRSYWKRTLVSSVAWAGLAWGQQPGTALPPAVTAKPAARERIVTIQETGRPPLKCKLVQSWVTPEGQKAYQVQAVDSGEMLTVVHSAASGSGGPVSTTIFHWGRDTTPPRGAPVPPPPQTVQTAVPQIVQTAAQQVPATAARPVVPTPAPTLSTTQAAPALPAPSATQTMQTVRMPERVQPVSSGPRAPGQGDRIVTIQEEGRGPQACRVVKSWRSPEGMQCHQVQSMQTGEYMTIEDGPAPASATGRLQAAAQRIYHWGRNTTPPAGVPVPPETAVVQQTPVVAPATPRPTPPVTVAQQTPATPPATPRSHGRIDTIPVVVPASRPAVQPTVAQVEAPTPPKPATPAPSTTPAPVPTPVVTHTAAASKPSTPAVPTPASPAPSSEWVLPTDTHTAKPAPAKPAMETASRPTTPAPTSTPVPQVAPASAPTQVTQAAPAPAVKPSEIKPAPAKPAETRLPEKSTPPAPVVLQTPPAVEVPASQAPAGPGRRSMVQKVHDYFHPPVVFKPLPPEQAQSTNQHAAPAVPAPTMPAPEKTAASSTTTRTETKPAKQEFASLPARNWRDSWGKADDHRSTRPTEHKPLPQSVVEGPDPLKSPQQFARKEVVEQAGAAPTAAPPATRTTSSSPAPSPAAPVVTKPAAVPVAPESPLGAQSVLAAGGAKFVPVPVVTVPDVRHPPAPPVARPPQPPQPTTPPTGMAVNAFSTPAPRPQPPAVPVMANAFTTPQTVPVPPQASNAFTVPVQPQAPAGYARVQGPGGQVSQASYQPAAGQAPGYNGVAHAPAGFQPAPEQRQALVPQPQFPGPMPQDKAQLLATLKDSLYPSQREWAAENLARHDARAHPDVIDALVTAAKEDPAATVRAGCVRCLAKMKASSPAVVSAVQALKADSDARVRDEVERALPVLSTSPSVQPAGFVVPGSAK